jgi:hypothetical protein
VTPTLNRILRLPLSGAFFVLGLFRRTEVDVLIIAGAVFVAAGAWYYSEGAGKIAVGVFLLLGGILRTFHAR